MATLDSLQASIGALTARLVAVELALKSKADVGPDGMVLKGEIPFASDAELRAVADAFNQAPLSPMPAPAAANLLSLATVALLGAGIGASHSVRVPLHLNAGTYRLLLSAAGLVGGGLGIVLTTPGGSWVAGTSTKLVAGSQPILLNVPATADYLLVFDAGGNGGGVVTLPILTPAG